MSAVALLGLPGAASAYSNGITGRWSEPTGCAASSGCHGTGGTATTATVNFLDTPYVGLSGRVRITVTNAAMIGAGFDFHIVGGDIAADSGSDPWRRQSATEATHHGRQGPLPYSWIFDWTPSTTGSHSWALAVNALNSVAGNDSGDNPRNSVYSSSVMVYGRPDGYACGTSSDCANYCVSGLCCDSQCTSTCHSCNSSGVCTAAGTEPVEGPTACCPALQRWNGSSCVYADECDPGPGDPAYPCANTAVGYATCTNTNTGYGYTCDCPDGYTGDGRVAGTGCTYSCGDGIVQDDAGEECDEGTDPVTGNGGTNSCCSSTCEAYGAGTACRASAGDCDPPELCGGPDDYHVCDPDSHYGSSVVCRPSAGLLGMGVTGNCDPEERCDGGVACPADVHYDSSHLCRASVGVCDTADYCDGASDDCPTDVREPTTTVCSPQRGVCDVPDYCNGTDVDCPTERYEPSSTVCRPAAGLCDVAEHCSGFHDACPSDGVRPSSYMCAPSAGPCDGVHYCDGTDVGCPVAFFAAGTECRASVGGCDPAEVCNGRSATCPVDTRVPDGTSCSDSMVCNGDEICGSGICVAGTSMDCDDFNRCTADACSEPGGCMSTAIAGCCNVDANCDDGDVCTADFCSGAGGACYASPITGCCLADADCDDGNLCTTDGCNLTTNRCERTAVPGCCTDDAGCDDGNVCTTSTCDVSTGSCSTIPIEGCCVTDGDCSDGNTCTLDQCDPATNACTHDDIPTCCLADDECDDMDECTTDTCSPDTAECRFAPIPGCGLPDAGTGDDAGVMMDDAGFPMDDAGAGMDAGGVDAGGMMGGDAGVDAGVISPMEEGCSCRAVAPRRAPWGLGLLGLALLFVGRRRRRG